MHFVLAWLASIGEDVSLLANEFLPEFLFFTVIILVVLGIRRSFEGG